MKHLIEEFANSNLFGRDNYEYYTKVTGRVLRVQGEWICSFQCNNEYIALERYLLGEFQTFDLVNVNIVCVRVFLLSWLTLLFFYFLNDPVPKYLFTNIVNGWFFMVLWHKFCVINHSLE